MSVTNTNANTPTSTASNQETGAQQFSSILPDTAKVAQTGTALHPYVGTQTSSQGERKLGHYAIGTNGDDQISMTYGNPYVNGEKIPNLEYDQDNDDHNIWLFDGNDYVRLGSGDNTIVGAAGTKQISTGDGRDIIDLTASTDNAEKITLDRRADGSIKKGAKFYDHIINTKGGRDEVYTGAGNSLIMTGADADLVHAGAGDDKLLLDSGDDAGYGEDGNDYIFGDEGNDRINGGKGDDTLIGGSDNDLLEGGYGDDTLFGGTGDDVLKGDDDIRIINGRAPAADAIGNDFLNGGIGSDTLTGGFGNDVFVIKDQYNHKTNNYEDAGHDVITDFTIGEDKVRLYDTVSYDNGRSGYQQVRSLDEIASRSSVSGNDLVITLNNQSSVTIQGIVENGETAADVVNRMGSNSFL